MTKEKLISLFKNPGNLTVDMSPELKEVAEQYPYFVQPHLLMAKLMHDTADLRSDYYTQKAALYVSDRKLVYNYLHPTAHVLAEPIKSGRETRYSGNYFDLIEKVESEGGDTKQSLKTLAQRLKEARESMQQIPHKPILVKSEVSPSDGNSKSDKNIYIPTPDYFRVDDLGENKLTEQYAKKLIKEKKYAEAIGILNELNLIYPKKSIYFADQIRFLKKILVNTKK